jgi:Zn-dependent protease/CBS domain-containing protein
MNATVGLGRIAGVRVGLHWSVLGVAALLVVGLSAQLSSAFPGFAWTWYVSAAFAAAVMFVLSLLAHELAHAVVARRNGIEVDGITLWLLGGVARLRGEARTPGAEFRVAAVGPFSSVVVAGVFWAAAWLMAASDDGVPAVAVLGYLAWVNVLLAVFNVIPAAPLDGGRILRAAIWARRGDRVTATVWAARAGRVFGFLLCGLGLVRAIAGTGGGLWWILLGLFVVTMANGEEQLARTTAAVGGLRVRDVMTPDPDTVPGDSTVERFLHDVALRRRHATFPLVDEAGRLQGLITLNRLRSVPVHRRSTATLREVACPVTEIPLVEPDEPLSALLPRLGGCPDGRALVMVDGHLVGIVSPSDISRAAALHGLGARSGAGE